MTDRELLQQALEALELYQSKMSVQMFDDTAKALRERLAQPKQEPVAWGCNRYIEDDNGFQIGTDEPELAWGKYAPDDNGWWPLYTSPPPCPTCEALARTVMLDQTSHDSQRKPLTDEEIIEMAKKTKSAEPGLDGYILPFSFARAIEAAHGIKENT